MYLFIKLGKLYNTQFCKNVNTKLFVSEMIM